MRLEREIWRENAEHRGHDIARNRAIGLDGADHVDRASGNEHLFMRFAKRGGDGVFARFHAPARERHLPGVSAHMLAPHREDDTGLGAIGDGDQDCRGRVRLCPKLGQVAGKRRL
jgi:hypothetical protein